jgi:26S proteasome regulatory subunit N2
MDIVLNRDFRQTVRNFWNPSNLDQVLKLLVKLYLQSATPDYLRICECLVFLDDSKAVADILDTLLRADGDVCAHT